MPHYAGSGTNFSEERRMSETTPENAPDATDPDFQADGEPDTSQPTSPAPSEGDTAPDTGNSDPDAVTDGSVEEEGQPE